MQFKEACEFIAEKLAKELPGKLTYHNILHVYDVYEATKSIGNSEGVSAHEMELLLTAALYHDAGFLKEPAGHEEESCRIVQNILPAYGYPPDDIESICGMIRATKIPQTPNNHLEEILADADLDYLGRDDFFTTGETLYQEFKASEIVSTEDEWNNLQVRFLESHHYFTKTSVNLRQAKKEEHLKQVKAKLNI